MNTAADNRRMVAFDTAIPTPDVFRTSNDGGARWVKPWPCKKDHHPDNITLRSNGKFGLVLQCKICESEKRKEWRKKHPEKEAEQSRKKYERKLRREGKKRQRYNSVTKQRYRFEPVK